MKIGCLNVASPLTIFLCLPNGSDRFLDGDGDADAAFCFSTPFLRFIHQLESTIEVIQTLFQFEKENDLRNFQEMQTIEITQI